MTRRSRRTIATAAGALALGLVVAVPATAGSYVGFSIGGDGFGLSFGWSDWGVYGRSFSDPAWRVDYATALDGYGEWVWVSGLGQVWRPWVATDWRPYTHGRWVYTSLGWTWVAYEPWGYFPHHYGQWALTTFGWVWQPGYTYVPASVVWVRTGSYVGWYPRGPRGWSHAARGWHAGYDHGYRHGYGDGRHDGYHDGYADGWRDARYATYVEWRDLTADDVAPRAVPAVQVERRVASPVRTAVTPPTPGEVRSLGGRDVPRVRVEERTVQAGDRTLRVVRPEGVARSVEEHAKPTVRRALSREVVDRMEQRTRTLPSADRETVGRSSTRASDRSTATTTAPSSRSVTPDRSRAPSTRTTVPRSVDRSPSAVDRRLPSTSSSSRYDNGASRPRVVVPSRAPSRVSPTVRRPAASTSAPTRVRTSTTSSTSAATRSTERRTQAGAVSRTESPRRDTHARPVSRQRPSAPEARQAEPSRRPSEQKGEAHSRSSARKRKR